MFHTVSHTSLQPPGVNSRGYMPLYGVADGTIKIVTIYVVLGRVLYRNQLGEAIVWRIGRVWGERAYFAMLTDEMLDFYNHKIKDIGSM